MKLICISRLTFNSCGGTDQNDFLIINSTKINLSSALYLTNVTGLVINDTTFWRSAGYIIIMAEVVNSLQNFYTIDITCETEEKGFIKDNENRMTLTNNTVDLVILEDRNAIFNVTIRTP